MLACVTCTTNDLNLFLHDLTITFFDIDYNCKFLIIFYYNVHLINVNFNFLYIYPIHLLLFCYVI